LVDNELRDDYADIVKLYDANATTVKFINALKSLGSNNAIKRIDVFFMTHGSTNMFHFYDVSCTAANIQSQIYNLNIAPKLRLAYSTACYADSCSNELIAAGFDASIGAVGVNANSEVELPVFLKLWAWNWRLRDALAAAESPLTRVAADEAAKAYGRLAGAGWVSDVNSDKVLRGNPNLKIDS
jgi:hypothetical protein